MSSASPAEGRRTCPYCGEAILAVARNCPECDEDLSLELDAELSRAIAEGTAGDAAEGRFDPGTVEAFRRFRSGTMVTAALFALGVLLIAAGAAKSSPGLGGMGGVIVVVAVIPLLVMGIHDLLLHRPERLTTPRSAMETYVKCLREKRWEYGLSLVVPRGREGDRRRPAIEALRTSAASQAVDTPAGFAAFWTPFLHSAGSTVRTFSVGGIHVEETGPDTAVAGCVLKVTAYPSWVGLLILCNIVIALIVYFIIRKTAEVPLDMSLLKVNGRWYLVDAVPAFPPSKEAN